MNENDWSWRHPRNIVAWAIAASLILVAASITLSLLFFPRFAPGPFYPFFPFGGFFVFFWIFAIFWLLRWFVWPWGGYHPRRYWRSRDESYSILRERYARGEINQDQFDEMMRNLEQHD